MRNKGTFNTPFNFEIQLPSPIDATSQVTSISELFDLKYPYKGKKVVVTTPTDVNEYICIDVSLAKTINGWQLNGGDPSKFKDDFQPIEDQRLSSTDDTIFNSMKLAVEGVAANDVVTKQYVDLAYTRQYVFEGTWKVSEGLPTNVVSGLTQEWACTEGGTINIGTGDVTFAIGDSLISTHENVFELRPGSTPIFTVFGRRGDIVAQQTDYAGFYQALEDQRLSSTNDVVFNKLTIGTTDATRLITEILADGSINISKWSGVQGTTFLSLDSNDDVKIYRGSDLIMSMVSDRTIFSTSVDSEGGTALVGAFSASDTASGEKVMSWGITSALYHLTDVGGSGFTAPQMIIHGGEGLTTKVAPELGVVPQTTLKNLYLTSDNNIEFYTGFDNVGNEVRSYIDSDGNFSPGRNILLSSEKFIVTTFNANNQRSGIMLDSNGWTGTYFDIYANAKNKSIVRMFEEGLWLTGNSYYGSGFTGSSWAINEDDGGSSHIVTDYLTVRKSMFVYELVINKIRATNGSLWVTDCMKVFATDEYSKEDADGNNIEFNDDGSPVVYIRIYCEDSEFVVFAPGDLIRCQTWNFKDLSYVSSIFYVAKIDHLDDGGKWCAIRLSDGIIEGSDRPQVGDEVVRQGNDGTTANRDGTMYLTATDDGAPYLDVLDGVDGSSASGGDEKSNIRVRTTLDTVRVRFIMIKLPRGGELNELEVFDTQGNNIMLGKSTYCDMPGDSSACSYINNGDHDVANAVHHDRDLYIRVDLGVSIDVVRVVKYSRFEYDSSILYFANDYVSPIQILNKRTISGNVGFNNEYFEYNNFEYFTYSENPNRLRYLKVQPPADMEGLLQATITNITIWDIAGNNVAESLPVKLMDSTGELSSIDNLTNSGNKTGNSSFVTSNQYILVDLGATAEYLSVEICGTTSWRMESSIDDAMYTKLNTTYVDYTHTGLTDVKYLTSSVVNGIPSNSIRYIRISADSSYKVYDWAQFIDDLGIIVSDGALTYGETSDGAELPTRSICDRSTSPMSVVASFPYDYSLIVDLGAHYNINKGLLYLEVSNTALGGPIIEVSNDAARYYPVSIEPVPTTESNWKGWVSFYVPEILDVADTISTLAGKTKLRLGYLGGIPGQSGYGLWASSTGSVTSAELVLSSSGYAIIAGWDFTPNIMQRVTSNVKLWLGTDPDHDNTEGFCVGDVDNVDTFVRLARIGSVGVVEGQQNGTSIFKLVTKGTSNISIWNFDRYSMWQGVKYGSFGGGMQFGGTDSIQMQLLTKGSHATDDYVKQYYNDTDDWGIEGIRDGNVFFKLGSSNHIGHWVFNDTTLQGGNLILDSTGSIRHATNVFAINNDGSASFANGNVTMSANGDASFTGSVTVTGGNVPTKTEMNDAIAALGNVLNVYRSLDNNFSISGGYNGSTKLDIVGFEDTYQKITGITQYVTTDTMSVSFYVEYLNWDTDTILTFDICGGHQQNVLFDSDNPIKVDFVNIDKDSVPSWDVAPDHGYIGFTPPNDALFRISAVIVVEGSALSEWGFSDYDLQKLVSENSALNNNLQSLATITNEEMKISNGNNYVKMFYVEDDYWGLEGFQDNEVIFSLGYKNFISGFGLGLDDLSAGSGDYKMSFSANPNNTGIIFGEKPNTHIKSVSVENESSSDLEISAATAIKFYATLNASATDNPVVIRKGIINSGEWGENENTVCLDAPKLRIGGNNTTRTGEAYEATLLGRLSVSQKIVNSSSGNIDMRYVSHVFDYTSSDSTYSLPDTTLVEPGTILILSRGKTNGRRHIIRTSGSDKFFDSNNRARFDQVWSTMTVMAVPELKEWQPISWSEMSYYNS